MTLIYGYSDDLLEISGDINEEFGCWEKLVKFTCSDGTKGLAKYEGPRWKFTIQDKGLLFREFRESFTDDNDPHQGDAKEASGYTDVLILNDGLEWINVNGRIFRP